MALGLFSSLADGLKNVFGGGTQATQAGAPGTTPGTAPTGGAAPAPGTAPGTGAPQQAKSGAAAVSDSLAQESAALDAAHNDAMANAYGANGSRRETGGPTAADIEAQKKDLQSRMAANDALKDKFKIVDAKSPGDPSNTLTREEYEKVVKQYSDISQGVGDLKVNTAGMTDKDGKEFKDGAMADIGKMLQTKEGREMLTKLGNNVATDASGNPLKDASGNPIHRETTIGQAYQKDAPDPTTGVPPNKLDASGNPIKMTDNAYADYTNYNTATATAYRDASGNRQAGQNSDVGYNPGMSLPGSTAPSDVVLFHELRHAADMTTGNMDATTVDASAGVPQDTGAITNFEHQAVGIGNYAGTASAQAVDPRATVPWSENQYRASRAALATAGAPGSIPSEATMPQRPFYNGPMP